MITQPAILERVIEPNRGDLSPDVARYFLRLDFAPEDIARYRELSGKAQEGTLTPEEQAGLDDYLGVNTLLAIMQSKARVSLKGHGELP
jgi:hypothetical protein